MPGLQLVLMSERFTKRAKHGRIVKLLLHVKRKDENVLKCIFVYFPLILLLLSLLLLSLL